MQTSVLSLIVISTGWGNCNKDPLCSGEGTWNKSLQYERGIMDVYYLVLHYALYPLKSYLAPGDSTLGPEIVAFYNGFQERDRRYKYIFSPASDI